MLVPDSLPPNMDVNTVDTMPMEFAQGAEKAVENSPKNAGESVAHCDSSPHPTASPSTDSKKVLPPVPAFDETPPSKVP